MRTNNLKKIRENSGLNQENLAKKLSVSVATISQLENGITKLEKYISELLEIFGCTEKQLFGLEPIDLQKSKKELTEIRRINIILLSTRKNLTPSKIAKALGVNRTKITAFQGGYKDLSDENYQKIAELLNVSLEELSQEPKFYQNHNPVKNRNDQSIIQTAIEILDEINFDDPKQKSKMFPFAYDIIEDHLAIKDISKIEENLKQKEKQIELERELFNQLKQTKK